MKIENITAQNGKTITVKTKDGKTIVKEIEENFDIFSTNKYNR
jgi:hypothetical protein